jgi:putative DNA-invertase from lambdoid prophage Rac
MGLRTFAYLRVSTVGQTTDNQLLEIQAAGFVVEPQRVVAETVSGSVPAFQRPQFSKLLERIETGEILIVTKLDRLGRNASDVRSTVERLTGMGVKVHCLALGGVDLTSPSGKMIMSVLISVAELERDLLVERTQSGLARAKAQGKKLGRKPKLTPEDRSQIRVLKTQGASLATLAKQYGVSRSLIQHVMREASPL